MILVEIKKYNRISVKLLVISIAIYVLTISFGVVFRTDGEISRQPLINLTYITYVIWTLSFFSMTFNSDKSNPLIYYLIFLAVYLFINTLIFSDDLFDNLKMLLTFTSNILLLYFVSNVRFHKSFLHLIFKLASLGALLSSTLTLIDYFVIDIPFFNEVTIGLKGFEIRGGSGPFQSRTIMGSYYSILMSISLISFFLLKKPLYLLSFVISFLAMISTFNRGAPFAVVIVAVIFFFRKSKLNIKAVLKVTFISIILVIVFFTFFPEEQRVALEYLVLSSLNIVDKGDELSDSDSFRAIALKQILTDDLRENPLGHGFNHFYLKGTLEPISVHSNMSFIFYAGGIFGVIWLFIFLWKLYKFSSQAKTDEEVIIKYSLFSWALYSLTHMVIYTFLAWLLLGLLLNKYIYNCVPFRS